MNCMKNMRFSSRPRAKVRRQGPPGSARAQPCNSATKFGNHVTICRYQISVCMYMYIRPPPTCNLMSNDTFRTCTFLKHWNKDNTLLVMPSIWRWIDSCQNRASAGNYHMTIRKLRCKFNRFTSSCQLMENVPLTDIEIKLPFAFSRG